MKYFILLFLLVGCSENSIPYGYRVTTYVRDFCTTKSFFYCNEIRRFPYNDTTAAICDSREECNTICENLRRGYKKLQ